MRYLVSARIIILANVEVEAEPNDFDEARRKAENEEFVKDVKGHITDWEIEDWLEGPDITVISDEDGNEKIYR